MVVVHVCAETMLVTMIWMFDYLVRYFLFVFWKQNEHLLTL